MAKSCNITATFPAEVTDFGTVSSYSLTATANHIVGVDESGDTDYECYVDKRFDITIEGETEAIASVPAVGSTFLFLTKTWTVDEAEYGEENQGVGTYSIRAHYFVNLG